MNLIGRTASFLFGCVPAGEEGEQPGRATHHAVLLALCSGLLADPSLGAGPEPIGSVTGLAHELHHLGYERYLTTLRETLNPGESEALQFVFLSSLLLEGSATYLISGERDLEELSREEPYSGHLGHPESLVGRIEDILRSVQEGEIRSQSQLDEATADLLGSWFHSAGSFLLGVIDQARGLDGVMTVLKEPRTLLVAYNQAVEDVGAKNGLPRFHEGVAGQLLEIRREASISDLPKRP